VSSGNLDDDYTQRSNLMENQVEKELSEVVSHGIVDASIMHLVLCANFGVSVEVTIVTGGQVIAGELVSGKVYAEKTAANYRNANAAEEYKELLAKFFDDLALDYSAEDGNKIPLNYLHIKNPAYLKGDGNWLTINDAILRVAISKVDGFSPGKPKTI
jgi:hypothetical protein